MKSKWLKFVELARKFRGKTSVWRVEHKDSGDYLGHIRWYSQWRQYCFIPHICYEYSIILSQSCLRDIAEFIKEQMDKRR